jgi:hypothetical protein
MQNVQTYTAVCLLVSGTNGSSPSSTQNQNLLWVQEDDSLVDLSLTTKYRAQFKENRPGLRWDLPMGGAVMQQVVVNGGRSSGKEPATPPQQPRRTPPPEDFATTRTPPEQDGDQRKIKSKSEPSRAGL